MTELEAIRQIQTGMCYLLGKWRYIKDHTDHDTTEIMTTLIEKTIDAGALQLLDEIPGGTGFVLENKDGSLLMPDEIHVFTNLDNLASWYTGLATPENYIFSFRYSEKHAMEIISEIKQRYQLGTKAFEKSEENKDKPVLVLLKGGLDNPVDGE